MKRAFIDPHKEKQYMPVPPEIAKNIVSIWLNSLSQQELLEYQSAFGKYHYYHIIKPLIYKTLILGEYGNEFRNLLAWKLQLHNLKPIVIHDLDKFMHVLTTTTNGSLVKYFEKMDNYFERDSNDLSLIYQLILKNCKNLETIKYKFDKNDNCIYYLNNNVKLKNIFINCQYNLHHYTTNDSRSNSNTRNVESFQNNNNNNNNNNITNHNSISQESTNISNKTPGSRQVFFKDLSSIDVNLLRNAYDFPISRDLENLKYLKLYTTFKALPLEQKHEKAYFNNLLESLQEYNTKNVQRRERDFTLLFDEQEGRCPAINIFLKTLINENIYRFGNLKYLKFDHMSFTKDSIDLINKIFFKNCASHLKILEFNNVIEHRELMSREQIEALARDEPVAEGRYADYNNRIVDLPGVQDSLFNNAIPWKQFHALEKLVLNINPSEPTMLRILNQLQNVDCTAADFAFLKYLELSFFEHEAHHTDILAEIMQVLEYLKFGMTHDDHPPVNKLDGIEELVFNFNFDLSQLPIGLEKFLDDIFGYMRKTVTDFRLNIVGKFNQDIVSWRVGRSWRWKLLKNEKDHYNIVTAHRTYLDDNYVQA